jgi:hypothetical protein
MVRLSLASRPLKTESPRFLGLGTSFADQQGWAKSELCAEGLNHINLHSFVSTNLGKNISAGRNCLVEKCFGGQIFKQNSRLDVTGARSNRFLRAFSQGCFRHAETFSRRVYEILLTWFLSKSYLCP